MLHSNLKQKLLHTPTPKLKRIDRQLRSEMYRLRFVNKKKFEKNKEIIRFIRWIIGRRANWDKAGVNLKCGRLNHCLMAKYQPTPRRRRTSRLLRL